MKIFRSIIWHIACFLVVVTWTLTICLCAPFRQVKFSLVSSWSRTMTWLTKIMYGIEYKIEGEEHLKAGPAIFISKHQSAWETIAFLGILPRTCAILKKSLMYLPFFGWSLWLTHQIPIDRSQGIRSLKFIIREGQVRLKSGVSILVFPEGTRVAPYTHPHFQKSALALAKTSHFPIIPIAHNAGSVWPRNAFFKKPGLVTIVIGEPYYPADKSLSEIEQDLYTWMKTTMERIEGPRPSSPSTDY